MPKKTVWYCPCDCKTPKGMKKKFYIISSLFSHIIENHIAELDIKVMYKLKLPSDAVITVGKKRTADDYEDGFKEILSVEEEEEEKAVGADIDNLAAGALKDFSI